ncbi:MAG: hypothetical protein A2020_15220 [Lentisphaerae bacterium GWF2_45_14]|nr:MAG: hypothetical protein A2020_15220 [Lentisphaerae bacterium GWF2_45_14]
MKKIKLGISACLLGEKVRYDGQHQLDRFLAGTLSEYVDWMPVCPEVECGLPVPREAMHLAGNPESPRLVTVRSGIDHTGKMLKWAEDKLRELEEEKLCGFVFKSKSPSSGMTKVKVYSDSGMPTKNGIGLFAAAFMKKFPLLPVEDEGRINDPSIRENFIERIFVFARWRDFIKNDSSIKGLVDFHTRHKLLIMAHNPKMTAALGQIVAKAKGENKDTVFTEYITKFMETLKLQATVKKNVNVLQHIAGYFKKNLSADEKKELIELIDSYHKNLIPLIVPLTLLNHYVRKYNEKYLAEQFYLNPHPLELCLRNHV